MKRLQKSWSTKQSAQTDVCRPVVGESGPEGCHRKKALRPAERREVVTHLVTVNGLPVQRACRAVGIASSHLLSAARGLGAAGCASDRGVDHACGGQESVGVLEML